MSYLDLQFDKDSIFLVTGGAGFIGSNLCEAILAMGYKVRCLDDLSTGKKENIEAFISNPNLYLSKEILEITMFVLLLVMELIMSSIKQPESVPRSIAMPLVYEEINIKGTLNMMESARVSKVKKFVYASSSSVYGDEPNLPKVEDRIGKVLSPYALTKKTNEEYGRIYYELYGLETVGLRYFNVFGRRQDPNGVYAAVIPKFIKQLLNDEQPITW